VRGSLQRRLSLTLAWVIMASGLAAAAASLAFGYLEAQEMQDDSLQQIAALAPRESGRSVAEDESGITVVRLPGDPRPAWLPQGMGKGFHTLEDGGQRMRVFVRVLPSGERLVVAQATQVRDELAVNSALRTLVPVLLLLPLLAWLTSRVVARELAPVKRLALELDRQPADRLEALSHEEVPSEIAPFIQAINRLMERVARLVGEQRRFVADAAHELRTPLTALSLQAQNLESAPSPEAARERVAQLRAGIERAQRLTEQLLSLASAQAGGGEPRPLKVGDIARELIEEFLPAAARKNMDLGLEVEEDLAIRASPEALRMILANALDNALRHTPAGGQITLRAFAEGDDAVIEAIDNGPGIPPSDRERVFDAFHRLPGAEGSGTGLGLAIARDAAARLGGEVSLDAGKDGLGLVFRYRQSRMKF
jgi:two-component system, OmpR family, sensor kinase